MFIATVYEHLVTTLTYDKETVELEDITAALLSYDMRKKNSAEEVSHGDGLLIKGELGSKGQEVRKNGKKKKKKNVQCYKCKEWGHWKRDCPELNGGSSANISTHDGDLDGNVLLVAGGVMESEVAGVAAVFHGGGESEEDSSGSPL